MMILYELLRITKAEQKFVVFVTNDYGENLFVGDGTRAELLDETENEDLFDHLMDRIDIIEIAKDGKTILVFVRDENFNKRVKELYSEDYVEEWDTHNPNTRPYLYYHEIMRMYPKE